MKYSLLKVLKAQNLLICQDALVKEGNKLRKGVFQRNKFALLLLLTDTVQSNVAHWYIKIKDLKNREPMYI
ncbi:hypothetical protein GCM10008905_08610 [Clostridium malenominatum]|uniref:Uncharacterized protein n=1 Tax=Clostridium malenominatum TaxID=1539 RepID=A0ABN1IS84_9CLOT